MDASSMLRYYTPGAVSSKESVPTILLYDTPHQNKSWQVSLFGLQVFNFWCNSHGGTPYHWDLSCQTVFPWFVYCSPCSL